MKRTAGRRASVRIAMALVLVAVSALVTIGCEGVSPLPDADSADDDATLDVVPVVGFSPPSGLGNIVSRSIIPEGTPKYEIYYVLNAPIITGFTPNVGGKGHGDSLSFPFLDTVIELEITRSAGTFTFDGTFANGKGLLRLTYTPSTRRFSYEHIAYVFDEHDVLGNSSEPVPGEPEPRFIEAAIYTVIDNIEVQPNGPFHGPFSGYVDMVMRDGEGGFVFEGHQAMVNGEIYHGPMTLPGVEAFTGTGIAAYMTYGGSEGDRPEGVSGSPSIGNLDAMRDALAGLDTPVENPFLVIWNQDADAFYDYSADHELFGVEVHDELSRLWDFGPSEEDRDFFISLLPTGGWQENTLQPPLP